MKTQTMLWQPTKLRDATPDVAVAVAAVEAAVAVGLVIPLLPLSEFRDDNDGLSSEVKATVVVSPTTSPPDPALTTVPSIDVA